MRFRCTPESVYLQVNLPRFLICPVGVIVLRWPKGSKTHSGGTVTLPGPGDPQPTCTWTQGRFENRGIWPWPPPVGQAPLVLWPETCLDHWSPKATTRAGTLQAWGPSLVGLAGQALGRGLPGYGNAQITSRPGRKPGGSVGGLRSTMCLCPQPDRGEPGAAGPGGARGSRTRGSPRQRAARRVRDLLASLTVAFEVLGLGDAHFLSFSLAT